MRTLIVIAVAVAFIVAPDVFFRGSPALAQPALGQQPAAAPAPAPAPAPSQGAPSQAATSAQPSPGEVTYAQLDADLRALVQSINARLSAVTEDMNQLKERLHAAPQPAK